MSTYSRKELYRDDQPRQPEMMLYVLQAVGIGGWVFGSFLLIGSHFLLETRLLLGGMYMLIGTNAAIGGAVLWRLDR
jgi:hypothetical protein